jgi:hypothetical protein
MNAQPKGDESILMSAGEEKSQSPRKRKIVKGQKKVQIAVKS